MSEVAGRDRTKAYPAHGKVLRRLHDEVKARPTSASKTVGNRLRAGCRHGCQVRRWRAQASHVDQAEPIGRIPSGLAQIAGVLLQPSLNRFGANCGLEASSRPAAADTNGTA